MNCSTYMQCSAVQYIYSFNDNIVLLFFRCYSLFRTFTYLCFYTWLPLRSILIGVGFFKSFFFFFAVMLRKFLLHCYGVPVIFAICKIGSLNKRNKPPVQRQIYNCIFRFSSRYSQFNKDSARNNRSQNCSILTITFSNNIILWQWQ